MPHQSEIAMGYIRANSYMSQSVSELWEGEYDLSLLASSWDERCVCVTSAAGLSLGHAIVVMPKDKDAIGLRDTHDDRLCKFVEGKSASHELFSLETGDLSAWPRLKGAFHKFLDKNPRPGGARVFVDISTCPRFLSLAFLKEALHSGLVRSLDLAYSEGVYPPAPPSYEGIEEISFRDGPIYATPVPGYLGDFDPGKEKAIVASIGFDGWKTLNLLTREEPDAVSILLASPAATPDYEARALKSNAALIQRFLVSENEVLRARAGDAVAAANALFAARKNLFGNRNIYYLCAGNKAHSLGLALDALISDSVTLLYVRPTRRSPIPVQASGTHWRYAVEQNVLTHFSS